MHNHILHGLDDGAAGEDESHQMRIGLKDRGIDTCIFTPHIFKELYPNNEHTISKKYNLLKTNVNYNNEFPNDKYAAEYMLNQDFLELLDTNTALLCFKDKKVLIEFSTIHAPIFYKEVFFKLTLAGYTPVIAHPERCLYLENKYSDISFEHLHTLGCEFQLNLLSLNGNYGKQVKNFAESLLKKGLYKYASTDIHHPHQLRDIDQLLHSYTWKKWSKYPFKNHELT
jgi:tyrosine-protein phosphatase YwqE